MKLVCDCGNEMEFKIQEEVLDYDGYFAKYDRDKIELRGEHDIIWIVCKNKECKKAIWLFT